MQNPIIDQHLVRRLVASQFPQWSELPVRPVASDGWDNRTFHLGDTMSVRLPSAEGYVPQIEKEHRWLPVLAPHLPLPIPTPLALGAPGEGYPFPWSVYGWIEGDIARGRIADPVSFATDLGRFLRALQALDATAGPPAGAHSAYRGAPLETYDEDTRMALAVLGDRIPSKQAAAVWQEALEAPLAATAVWFHGDVAVGNLLVQNGRLSAVIDFGCCGVGDPACDTVIAWNTFDAASRAAFRAALPLDDATWTRGRGWAIWKALITLAGLIDSPGGTDAPAFTESRRALDEVIVDTR